jgi:hypothetical protein
MSMDITNLATHVALLCYAAACLTLLLYRRQGARHRHHVSWAAWGILVILSASGIALLLSPHPASWLEAGRAVLIDLFIFGARGNVARLLWSE